LQIADFGVPLCALYPHLGARQTQRSAPYVESAPIPDVVTSVSSHLGICAHQSAMGRAERVPIPRLRVLPIGRIGCQSPSV
jgi:hypothetical protein